MSLKGRLAGYQKKKGTRGESKKNFAHVMRSIAAGQRHRLLITNTKTGGKVPRQLERGVKKNQRFVESLKSKKAQRRGERKRKEALNRWELKKKAKRAAHKQRDCVVGQKKKEWRDDHEKSNRRGNSLFSVS